MSNKIQYTKTSHGINSTEWYTHSIDGSGYGKSREIDYCRERNLSTDRDKELILVGANHAYEDEFGIGPYWRGENNEYLSIRHGLIISQRDNMDMVFQRLTVDFCPENKTKEKKNNSTSLIGLRLKWFGRIGYIKSLDKFFHYDCNSFVLVNEEGLVRLLYKEMKPENIQHLIPAILCHPEFLYDGMIDEDTYQIYRDQIVTDAQCDHIIHLGGFRLIQNYNPGSAMINRKGYIAPPKQAFEAVLLEDDDEI